MSIDDKYFALLENRKTRAGGYVTVGDSYLGYPVLGIDRDSVTIQVDGRQRSIPFNVEFQMTSLSPAARVSANSTDVINESISGERLVHAISLDLNGTVLLSDGADNEQLKNEVFEGKMTLDEYHQKASETTCIVELGTVSVVNLNSGDLEAVVDQSTYRMTKIRQ